MSNSTQVTFRIPVVAPTLVLMFVKLVIWTSMPWALVFAAPILVVATFAAPFLLVGGVACVGLVVAAVGTAFLFLVSLVEDPWRDYKRKKLIRKRQEEYKRKREAATSGDEDSPRR